jgi:hypothetical protein
MTDYECSICKFSNHYKCKCKTDSTDFCNENAIFNSLKNIETYVFVYNANDIQNASTIFDVIKCKYVIAININFNSIVCDFTPSLQYNGSNNITGLWEIDSKLLNEYSFDININNKYYGLNICMMCFSQFIMNDINQKKNRTCINRLTDICDTLIYDIGYDYDCENITDNIKKNMSPLSSTINEVIEVNLENKEDTIREDINTDDSDDEVNSEEVEYNEPHEDKHNTSNHDSSTHKSVKNELHDEFFTPNFEHILENVFHSK